VQTTLLGLGIAIILALVAALVGPYFVDWSAYRATFEREATRIVGMPVTIGGKIDARLLPVPSVTLHGVEGRKPNGEPKFTANEISVEFALGPLMRGQWRISEMHLAGPRIGIGLAADGRVDWVGTEAGIDPNSLAIEHLTIEGGRVILADAASGSWTTLNQFSFTGALRSLAGPIKGDGSFVTRAGQQHGYHLSAGRIGDDGGMHVRLTVDPADPPLATEVDGTLRFENAAPRFEGTLKLTRQSGVSLARGHAVTNDPWTLTGKVKTTAASAKFDALELEYGPDDRALKLGGTAELKFGTRPRIDAVVSTRQLDLDRFVALPPQTRRLPLVALRSAADVLGDALRPTIPVHIGLSVDAMTLADATLQNVHGDFSADEQGWSVDKLELRAPGVTQVHASGRLGISGQGPSFSGPATIESADPKALAAWLQGGATLAGVPVGALRVSGEVTLAPDRFAVDRLSAALDQRSVSGRIDYTWNRQDKGPRLEAALSAADLDLDAAAALMRKALPGVSPDLPAECVLALDIGHATVAGLQAERAKAKLRLGPDGLAIDELTIGNFGGAAIALSGQVKAPWSTPTGALTMTVDGKQLDGLVALLADAAPQAAGTLVDVAPRLGAAKLKLSLALDRPRDAGKPAEAAAATRATLHVDGQIGALKIAWSGDARGDPANWTSAAFHSVAQIDAVDGRALASLLGLGEALTLRSGPGSLHLATNSAPDGALALAGRLVLPGAVLGADGVAHFGDGGKPTGNAEISATIADATALRPLIAIRGQPAPLSFKARLAAEGDHFVVNQIVGRLGDSNLTGNLVLTTGHPMRIEGNLDADRLHVDAVLAALAGVAAKQGGKAVTTSMLGPEPFGARFLSDATGRIAVTAAHASVGPKLDLQQWASTLRLKENEAAVEDIRGTLAGGKVTGSATLQRGVEGIAASLRVGLTGADIATLWPGTPRPPMTGRVSLQIEAKGSGRSPAALVETLGGSGSVSAEDLALAGLDPVAFDAAARMADQSVDINPHKLKSLIEPMLAGNPLHLKRLDGAFTLTAGQLRLGGVIAHADKADLGLNAIVDLAKASIDVRATLVGAGAIAAQTGGRPEISVLLKGPLAAPTRTVDVSTLAGWLTLRAVDQQAKRLEAAEAERRKADEAARRMEEAARQEAVEQQRRAAQAAAEQQQRAQEAARSAPPPPAQPVTRPASPSLPKADQPLPKADQPTVRAPALPPPIEIRPVPGQRRTNDAHQAPHTAKPAHENVLRPPAVTFQRDPRLPSLP
jgi:large subunit ribosomal protein L24